MTTLSEKRRAIYTGLSEYLHDDALLHATLVWESKYSSQPTFALQRFMSDICAVEARLRPQRGQILQSLVRALSTPPDQLLPDPSPLLDDYRKSRGGDIDIPPERPPTAAAPSSVATPALLEEDAQASEPMANAFQKLMESLCNELGPKVSTELRARVLKESAKLNFPERIQRAVVAWGKQGAPLVLNGFPARELTKLINTAYVAMCEMVGPVKSDEVLGRAVEKTERATAQSGFSIRELL